MRFSQLLLGILPFASTCFALPTPLNTLDTRQLPEAIIPPGGPVTAPSDSTLVQVGFEFQLNYDFVANNPAAANQIFNYLPGGIAYGLDIPTSSVVIKELAPLDTTASLGYITTLARFYIPSDQVTLLNVGLRTPSSRFYNNPDSTTKALMDLINPSISTSVS